MESKRVSQTCLGARSAPLQRYRTLLATLGEQFGLIPNLIKIQTVSFAMSSVLPPAPLDASLPEQLVETIATPPLPVLPTRQSGASIVRNTLVANLATLFSIFTGFFLTPILLRALGTDTFGVWSLALGIIGQLEIIQLGLNTAIPQQVAAKLALGDRDGLDKIFSTAFAAYLACAAFSLLATGVFIFIAPHFFKVPPTQLGTIRWTLLVLGLNQALAFGVALRDALVFWFGPHVPDFEH